MLETQLPAFIELDRYADRQAQVQVRLSVSQLPRVMALLTGPSEPVAVEMQFARDARGFVRLTGRVQATLPLTCQRCLTSVETLIESQLDVYLLRQEANAERLDEADDYVVVGDERCAIYDVLEDELILSLPVVPRHEVCAPDVMAQLAAVQTAVAEPEMPRRDNPFDVLAGLKKPTHE